MSLLAAFAAVMITTQFPDTFLGSVSIGRNPVDICISPDGKRAYAAVQWGFAAAVDINGYSDFTLAGLVTVDGEPVSVQCNESGSVLYIADSENSLVHVVNTETLSIENSFPVEASPADMVLSPEQNRIFLSHSQGMVTVINTLTSSVEGVFWAGNSLHSLCASPDGEFIYAADNGSPRESVITAATGSVNRFTSGMDSRCAALSGNGERLFLSCTDWSIIEVILTEDLEVETVIPCPVGAPVEMASLPVLPYLYCLNPENGLIEVYSTDDLSFTGDFQVPGGPVNFTVHPDGERIFFVCQGDSKMKMYGNDPAFANPGTAVASLIPSASPCAIPSVLVSGFSGMVSLRGYDVSGRMVWAGESVLSGDQTAEFCIQNTPPGLLFVTAESESVKLTTAVVVLQP